MLFHQDLYVGVCLLKCEERDHIVTRELRSHWATDQLRELGFAERDVLLDLDDVKCVAPSLGLYRDDVLAPARINSNIQFVGFDLPDGQARMFVGGSVTSST